MNRFLKCKYSQCNNVYQPCINCNKSSGIHWSEVACCKEHFQKYMEEVFSQRELEDKQGVKKQSLKQEKSLKQSKDS